MQRIQDKEFDQLFKDKFEAAEVQPSADLWGNIAAQLAPGRQRKLPVYWIAAAIGLITVGIGLIRPETEKIRLQGQATLLAQTDPAVTARPLPTQATESIAQDESTPLIIAPRLNPDEESKVDLKAAQPKQVKNMPVNVGTVEPEKRQPLRDQVPVAADQTVLASAGNAEIQEEAAPEEKAVPHKGIRNAGDVINFVVSKLDKREKKIIEFDTDDDNSSVVAFNIGFLKFNKRSDK